MSIFSKKEDQTDISSEAERKIDFAKKLSEKDLEGSSSPKGGDFNFLKGLNERKDGEAVPVILHPEPPVVEDDPPAKEAIPEKVEKEPRKSLFNSFKKESRGESEGRRNLSKMLEVNLVKGEIVKFFDWQKGATLLLISIFISLTFLSLVYWGISWWGSSRHFNQESSYLQDYYKVNREIKELDPQVSEVLAFKDRLDLVNFLLDRHIYWTEFFNFLEDNTLSNVYFFSFTGDVNGNYTLQATTDNLDAIDAQIKKLLANPKVKKAEVRAGSVGGEKGKSVVSFSLSFTLTPDIFLK